MTLGSNMTMYDHIKEHCLIVNNGSGVLVNAMTEEYSYVLTARHVVADEDECIVKTESGNSLNVIEVHLHTDVQIDCAIIQIEYHSNIQQQTCSIDSIEHHAPLMLAGFPSTRRSGQSPEIKQHDGKKSTVNNGEFVFTAEGIPPQTLIDGMSGGGVYYICGSQTYLVGVEFRMDGSTSEECFGRIRCHELSRFEEIITQNRLSPMIPYFMECFSRVQDDIFDFNVIDPNNTSKLKEKLNDVAQLYIRSGLALPYKFMEKHNDNLIVNNEHDSAMQDKELWVAYLEFLIISLVLDETSTIDESYLSTLERKRRIIYSRSNKNWVRQLSDILKLAKTLLDENGTIIVNAPNHNGNPPVSPPEEALNNVIDDISSVPTGVDAFQIDNTNEDIYKTFTVVHHGALLDKCVVESEYDFGSNRPSEQLNLFKRKYNETIT